MNSVILTRWLALSGFIFSLCFPLNVSAIRTLDKIIAIVNDDVITQTELDARVTDYAKQLKLSNGASPEFDALKKQVLERMIQNRIQSQLAEKLGIKIDDIALNRMLEELAKSNKVTLAVLKSKLEEEGIEFNRFREQTREELIIKQLQQRVVANKVSVTEQEIKQLIEQELGDQSENTKFHLLHILIATPESATPDDIIKGKEKALRVHQQIIDGASFKDIAIKKSDGRNALDGGDLGWRKAGELPQDFVSAANKLAPGETSLPIRSASGYHLIQLVEKSTGQVMVIQTHARHILIRTSSNKSDKEAERELSEIKTRMLKGEDFAQLASEFSDDPGSKENGGDLGWADPGTFVEEFTDVMDKLKVKEISEPFRSQFGWHLMQVLGRQEQNKTQTSIEAQARGSIRKRKIDEELSLWQRRIRDEAYVEYTDKTLNTNSE